METLITILIFIGIISLIIFIPYYTFLFICKINDIDVDDIFITWLFGFLFYTILIIIIIIGMFLFELSYKLYLLL